MTSEDGDDAFFDEILSPRFPSTQIVLQLSCDIKPEALSWFVKKITAPNHAGGAELLVRCEPIGCRTAKDRNITLHISASKLKFEEMAELMDFKNSGPMDGVNNNNVELEFLKLSSSEKQIIVLHELENIRSIEGEKTVPGYPSLQLHSGESIFQLFLIEKLLTAYYPLHEGEQLNILGNVWYKAIYGTQPFEKIREYFGESLSLYFIFLEFYTLSLFAPAILGILQLIFYNYSHNYSLLFFSVFNIIWVTVILELWKRKSSTLAYSWGTLEKTKWENPRSNYRGKMSPDPVTGRYQPYSPWWKTGLKVYGVSLPIVVICLIASFYVMLFSFWLGDVFLEIHNIYETTITSILIYLPSIGYAGIVYVMNVYYRQLAYKLTEFENHRTESQFERYLITKLIPFEFVNNFTSLFYIAFYLQDLEMLKFQIFLMLNVLQFINHFQETIFPFLSRQYYANVRNYIRQKSFANFNLDETDDHRDFVSKTLYVDNNSLENAGLELMNANDLRIITAKTDGQLNSYTGTFDDYLELFIQFGYVFLFASVYPMAALWAILNNVLEIRTDAFKLCKVFQRPIARRAKDIGVWQIAFEVMGALAVMTNCGLLCLSPEIQSIAPTFTQIQWVLIFVFIEHCLIALILALRQIIPDIPTWVKIAMCKAEFESRQLLKETKTSTPMTPRHRTFKTASGTMTTITRELSLNYDAQFNYNLRNRSGKFK